MGVLLEKWFFGLLFLVLINILHFQPIRHINQEFRAFVQFSRINPNLEFIPFCLSGNRFLVGVSKFTETIDNGRTPL